MSLTNFFFFFLQPVCPAAKCAGHTSTRHCIRGSRKAGSPWCPTRPTAQPGARPSPRPPPSPRTSKPHRHTTLVPPSSASLPRPPKTPRPTPSQATPHKGPSTSPPPNRTTSKVSASAAAVEGAGRRRRRPHPLGKVAPPISPPTTTTSPPTTTTCPHIPRTSPTTRGRVGVTPSTPARSWAARRPPSRRHLRLRRPCRAAGVPPEAEGNRGIKDGPVPVRPRRLFLEGGLMTEWSIGLAGLLGHTLVQMFRTNATE